MYTQEERDLIALDAVHEINYNTRKEITDNFTYSRPREKYSEKLIKTLGVGVYNKIKDNFYNENARQKHLDMLEEESITCVTLFSQNYPKLLRVIPSPPSVLYCRGDVSLFNTKLFTVVGSRKAPKNSLKITSGLSGDLTQHFTVVTGLAEGADSAAAYGALKAGGKVIGVVAGGLDNLYPKSNTQLFKRVENEGLLVSESLPDVKPRRYLFPIRNRILAGLSQGLLITAAGTRSGTFITAEYGFKYGRDVFSFPYSVGLDYGEGCNKLIKKGAYLTENILDIFGVYGLDFKAPEEIKLTDSEKRIADYLKSEGEAHITQLAAALGCETFELLADISSLEMKGMLTRLGGNRYSIN